MVLDNHQSVNDDIILTAPCETFICSVCGKEYPSRGIAEPGNICRKCERYKKAGEKPLAGGPLNGEVIK